MYKVAVILCTYNSEKYILEQLDSIFSQKNCTCKVYISDDGSYDNTLKFIHKYSQKNPNYQIDITNGPGKGFAKNFLWNLRRIDKKYDFYAFSDHDDVWNNKKILRASSFYKNYSDSKSFLYCSRTTLVDRDLNVLGKSIYFRRPPAFENALVQSIAGGNTMIFNSELKKIIDRVDLDSHVVSHDWLTYILVTFTNGNIVYDKKSYVKYRMHGKNIVGSNKGMVPFFKRALMVFNGEWSKFSYSNLNHLKLFHGSSRNVKILDDFIHIRSEKRLIYRLLAFKKSKIYRQTLIGNISLMIAIILRKI